MIRTYSEIAERLNNKFDNVEAEDGGLAVNVDIDGELIGSIGRDGAKQWKWLIKHRARNENYSFYDRETIMTMAKIISFVTKLDKDN